MNTTEDPLSRTDSPDGPVIEAGRGGARRALKLVGAIAVAAGIVAGGIVTVVSFAAAGPQRPQPPAVVVGAPACAPRCTAAPTGR